MKMLNGNGGYTEISTSHRVLPNTGVGAKERRDNAQERIARRAYDPRSPFNYLLYQSLLPSLVKERLPEGPTPQEIADLMRSCGGCEPWITRQPDGSTTIENDVVRMTLYPKDWDEGKRDAHNKAWHRRLRHSRTRKVDLGGGLTVEQSV